MNIRSCIKLAYASFLNYSGKVSRECEKGGVIILMLHKVNPKSDPLPLTLAPDLFDHLLEEITSRYEVISIDDVIDQSGQVKGFNEVKFVITFDDGYKDNYEYAYPILKKYNVPATIYLSLDHINGKLSFWYEELDHGIRSTCVDHLDLTEIGSSVFSLKSEKDKISAVLQLNDWLKNFSVIDRRNKLDQILAALEMNDQIETSSMLSWDMIKEMDENGINFGSHTLSHPILSRETKAQEKIEVTQSKIDLEKKLEHEITGFAYPNGTSEDFTEQTIEFVRTAGYQHATSTIEFTNFPGHDRFALGRVNLNNRMCAGLDGTFHRSFFWSKVTCLL